MKLTEFLANEENQRVFDKCITKGDFFELILQYGIESNYDVESFTDSDWEKIRAGKLPKSA